MFTLAILVGLYSYGIFFLGLLGILYKWVILLYTLLFIAVSIILLKPKTNLKFPWVSKFVLFLIVVQVLVNLVGVFGPEISFDALWYHLTIPKIYAESNSVFFIPGNLLYYSGMPKLVEMLFLAGLSLLGDVGPKLIHFSFGILTLFVVYKIARNFVSEKLSFLASGIFYSNLVVGWESISAYADLARTFFEASALLSFIYFVNKKKVFYLFLTGCLLGFAIAIKLLAAGSIIIFLALIAIFIFKRGIREIALRSGLFLGGVLLVTVPHFLTTYVWTGNPFYPVFDNVLIIKEKYNFNLFKFPGFVFELFLKSSDPLSPVYIIILPLVFLILFKLKSIERIVLVYSILFLFIVFITPHIGGGRFILPALPVLSVFCVICINHIRDKLLANVFLYVVVLSLIISIGYRSFANYKFVPVLLGKESEASFLSRNLNFSFGDFYDLDGFFEKNIKKDDKVLVYGVHNLYYIDFSFKHYTYAKKGEVFNYVLVQNSTLPERFKTFNKIYHNNTTRVKLYSNGKKWAY